MSVSDRVLWPLPDTGPPFEADFTRCSPPDAESVAPEENDSEISGDPISSLTSSFSAVRLPSTEGTDLTVPTDDGLDGEEGYVSETEA